MKLFSRPRDTAGETSGGLLAQPSSGPAGPYGKRAGEIVRECAFELVQQSGLSINRSVRRRLRKRLLPRSARTAGKPSGGEDPGVPSSADWLAASSSDTRNLIYLAAIVLAFVVVTAIRDWWTGVHLDEANWLMQTEHLQAGYFFHPPFLVYELFAIKKLLGTSPFALRSGSLAFTTVSLILVHAISMKIFGDPVGAAMATLVVAALPITNYWLTLGQQDPPMMTFWLMTMYLVLEAISKERPGYWYLAGITAGFMRLCNLRSSVLPVGIFAYLLTSARDRHWLARKEPYQGFAITVAMFIPTLIWYARHRFEPILYQLRNRPGFMQYDLPGYLRFVLVHVIKEKIVLSPAGYALSALGITYGGYQSLKRNGDERFRFLFWTSAPMVAFFTVTGGSAYWAVPGHMVSLIAAMGALPEILSRTRWKRLEGLSPKSIASLSALLALLFTAGTLAIVGDGGKADSMKLAGEVDRVLGDMPVEETYVASSDYFLPSIVYYYQKQRPAGYTLAFQVFEHKALAAGKTSKYSPWTPLESIAGKNMVFVVEQKTPDGFELPESYWSEKLEPYFESLGEPNVVVGRERGKSRVFYVFACSGFKGPDELIDDKSGLARYRTTDKYEVDPVQF